LEGKRRPGDLEIHLNGLRFQTQLKSDQKIDILFSNIKHLFFQPCDGELLVILHVHLKNPIMIGKKKTKDIQFFREVSDSGFDETGARRRRVNYGDEDELAAEQEERKRRLLLNKEFQAFSEKVSEASKGKCDVDIPFRELGFQGVPNRQLCLLQPTTDCLVQLTEAPALVITLADVEIAHLERVQFGLKNFDLVFVFKDFKRPVIHINTIPVNQLENVKDWLE
jgi:nucleosome binding factor SPN SPT16 subunit